MKLLSHIGRYISLLKLVLKRPQNQKLYLKQIIVEIQHLGIESIGIVAIISIFMGAVVAIQMAFNIDAPFVPKYTIGFATRQSVILEFSPTVISLILAGKVGSRIASEIGSMRVTEQIDALEIMGINSATYLILPKIVAAMIINPVIIMMSMILSIGGGWLAGAVTGLVPTDDFIYGIQFAFKMYDVYYAFVKTIVFAFLITSIPAYCGYYTSGGALEVGKSSTQGVVSASIAVILSNLILTQILLA